MKCSTLALYLTCQCDIAARIDFLWITRIHHVLASISVQFCDISTGSKKGTQIYISVFKNRVEVNVYRKPTHTNRYLDFNSHHPICHMRSIVSTLLRRAKSLPSTHLGKREETKRVKAVLQDNNYPSSFINSCERSLSKLPTDLPSDGFVVLPSVQGISERVSRILRQQQIKVAFKPLRTVNSLYPRPKVQEKVVGHEANFHERLFLEAWMSIKDP